MKHKPKDYAKALVDLVSEKKSESQQKKLVDNFLKLLKKNGDLKKSKEIISLAEMLFLKKTGGRKIIFEMARETKKESFKGFLKKHDVVEEKINPDLIAGVKIVVNNEKQLDFSLMKKLNNIFS